jgi:DNA primase|tara:strand:- start:1206 stop:1964 length:759 start_codon:yes stop_codon:yes gene_type:complete
MVRRFGTYDQRQKWLQLDGRLDLSEFDKFFSEINDEVVEQTVSIPDEFVSLCNKKLPMSSIKAIEYLKSRGLSKEDILKWKIGYCTGGKYGGRIIIPSFNWDGSANYFIARSFVNNNRRYLNPPVGRDIVFNELYVDWDEDVVLVEGVFDAITVGSNAIPILGSTLRENSRLFQQIVLNDTPVYLALDHDAEKKRNWIIKSFLRYDIELYIIDTSGYEDIGSMSREEFLIRKEAARVADLDEIMIFDKLRAI